MSRWIEQFNNHQFQEKWRNLINESESITISDITVKTDVEELARLKKVLSYIDQLIKACDPELIPLAVLDNSLAQADTCILTGATIGHSGIGAFSAGAAVGAASVAAAVAQPTSHAVAAAGANNVSGGGQTMKAAFQNAQQNMAINRDTGSNSSGSSSGGLFMPTKTILN